MNIDALIDNKCYVVKGVFGSILYSKVFIQRIIGFAAIDWKTGALW
jgi:hypothetical protein